MNLTDEQSRFFRQLDDRIEKKIWLLRVCADDPPSLRDVADELGVSHTGVSKIEKRLRREFDPPADDEPSISERLEAIEAETGEQARTLDGCLCRPGNPGIGCPSEIVETVAKTFAITETGRLFHWRYGERKELEGTDTTINGVRWTFNRERLRNRAFPEREKPFPSGEVDPSDDPMLDRGAGEKTEQVPSLKPSV